MELKDPKDIEQTEKTYHQALAALGPANRTTLEAEYSYSWVLRWRGRNDQAIEHARTALVGLRNSVGDDDIRTMFASYNYASCLQGQAKFAEAATELRSLLDIRKRVLGPTHIDTIWAAFSLHAVLDGAGERAEAETVQKDMVSHLSMEKVGKNSTLMDALARELAISQDANQRDGKRAVEMATKACALSKYKDPDHIDTLAAAYAECGDREGTLKWSEKITELSPDFTVQYYNAMRFLWCGSVDEYRHACSAMIKEFATQTDDAPGFGSPGLVH